MAPRIPKSAPAAAPPAANPRAVPGDNSVAELEAERIQLISFVSKLTAADGAIEEAKAPYDAAKKARRQVVNLAKAAGFTAEELNARMEEMNNPQRDNPLRIAREGRHRLWLGIVRPEQTELQLGDKVPAEAKDEAHWKGEGYKAGLRQMQRKPPSECAERFVQPWMAEYDRGLKEVLIANAPVSTSQREKMKADFEADNPEVDVEAAARKLKKNPAFMARGAPEGEAEGSTATASSEPASAPTPTNTSDASTAISDGASPSTAEAPFEATQEELDAQAGRRKDDPAESEAVV